MAHILLSQKYLQQKSFLHPFKELVIQKVYQTSYFCSFIFYFDLIPFITWISCSSLTAKDSLGAYLKSNFVVKFHTYNLFQNNANPPSIHIVTCFY